MTSRALRVLIVADPRHNAAKQVLELAGAGILGVHSEPDFREAIRAFNPDAVLADQAFEPFSARAALEVLRRERPAVPLILLADAVDEQGAVDCLRAGAENLVLRSNLARLMAVIEAAVAVRRPLARLSPRQLEVLRLVSEGLTTREIAERLHLSVKTVDTHRATIAKRLGLKGLASLVYYAVRTGVAELETAEQRAPGGRGAAAPRR